MAQLLRQDFYISGCDDNKVYKVFKSSIQYIYYWGLMIVNFPNSHVDISQLILMTDLINNHALLVSFLECY